MKKYAYIDAVRGFAILGVVIVHTSHHCGDQPFMIATLAEMGQYGVQLFFVASALTLCLSSSQRMAVEESPLRNFFIRRYFRIAPMYYLGLLGYYLLRVHLFQDWSPEGYDTTSVLSQITLLHGWRHHTINYLVPGGWSIAVEFTFYLLFPILFQQIRSLTSSVVFIVLAIFLMLAVNGALGAFSGATNNSFYYLWFFTQLPVFGFGILAYHVMQQPWWRLWSNASDRVLKWCLAVGSVALYLVAVWTKANAILLSPLVMGIFSMLVVLFLSIDKSTLFVNPITIWLGRLSFSIYLIHFVFAQNLIPWVMRITHLHFYPIISFPVSLGLVTILSAAVAFLTYHGIELRFVRLGKSLIEKLEKA